MAWCKVLLKESQCNACPYLLRLEWHELNMGTLYVQERFTLAVSEHRPNYGIKDLAS